MSFYVFSLLDADRVAEVIRSCRARNFQRSRHFHPRIKC